MSTPLSPLAQRLALSRGALYEGDLFAILRRSPFVLRSFEFSLADGAVDCSREYDASLSYVRRLWDAVSRGEHEQTASELIPFDVKSTVGSQAGDQQYITTAAQKRRVAFYIGIVAADPTFVDVIPNYSQDAEALHEDMIPEAEKRDIAVNASRVCRLSRRAYGGIDQCMSPYRMPIALLPEATSRIRRCALEGIEYVNPWTRVRFVGWRPKTTRSTAWLQPAAHTGHASAFVAVLDIMRMTMVDEAPVTIEPDLIGMAPRLGDFKLILTLPSEEAGHAATSEQFIIQHKLDDPLHARNALLHRVTIARNDGPKRHFYFTATDRFDFLWFEFTFSRAPDAAGTQTIFYFLPESVLPDEFFLTTEKETSFARLEFAPYRISKDDDGDWVDQVRSIIIANRLPRRPGERPMRLEAPANEVASTEGQTLPLIIPDVQPKGPREYQHQLTQSLNRFYDMAMSVCAARRKGLIHIQASNAPMADIGYSRYSWTSSQRDAYFAKGQPPICAHHLPPETEFVPICYYTQHAECYYQGPMLRPRQFRRLDSCRESRLILWDLCSADMSDDSPPPVLIPSDDISPTQAQEKIFSDAFAAPKAAIKTPLLSALLSTGLFASDYKVPQADPRRKAASDWSSVLELLDQFLSIQEFEHPAGFVRDPQNYRQTIRAANQRLLGQHLHNDLHGNHNDPLEEAD